MNDFSKADYSSLDQPEILALLFHPRPDWGDSLTFSKDVEDIFIPVENGISIGAKLHSAEKSAPVILYFHGNGEIVSDYDDLGPVYTKIGFNFLPVDYRGYGRSAGTPTVTNMMRDCHVIFEYIMQWLKQKDYSGPIIVMGRSLGSASALELAGHYQNEIDGLIIESGFANVLPLLSLIGVDIHRLGIDEKHDLHNIDNMRNFAKPVLIIHAEYDHIIPFSAGQALFDASSSPNKKFLKIPDADHNTIFAVGMEMYLKEVKRLADEVIKKKE
ncbi:MAG: alpha/beta hydrolase [Proteobacteria bacterium]|nr:alpha/beta hydrolase [Pseudomonadota bacterium]